MTFVLPGRPRSFQYRARHFDGGLVVLLPVGIHEHRAVAADPHMAGSVNVGIVQRMDE